MTQIVLSQLLPYQDTTAVSTTSKHRTYLPGCLDYNRYRRSPTVHRTVWCAGTPDGKDASVGTPPCCRCFRCSTILLCSVRGNGSDPDLALAAGFSVSQNFWRGRGADPLAAHQGLPAMPVVHGGKVQVHPAGAKLE